MEFTDNAIKLYLRLSDKEKWAIRHFLRANSEDIEVADELLRVDGYISYERDNFLKFMAKHPGHQFLKMEYERFV